MDVFCAKLSEVVMALVGRFIIKRHGWREGSGAPLSPNQMCERLWTLLFEERKQAIWLGEMVSGTRQGSCQTPKGTTGCP
jgi:hypothetical protein